MKNLASGCLTFLLVAVVLIFAGIFAWFVVQQSSEPNVVGPKDACRYAAVWMPKEDVLALVRSKKYTTQELTNVGRCSAREVAPGLWYAKGVTDIPAMRANGLPPLQYEALLVVFDDPSSPAVRSFGDQLLPCSFRVNNVDSTPDIAHRSLCGEALNLSSFKQKHGI